MTKKWIAVIGSPRKGENTEKLVDIIADELKGKDITVNKFYLDMETMNPCTNCEYCISAGKCHIEDKISIILDKMKSADGVILASPSYYYNVTSQMKILIDRSFSLNDYSDSGWSSRVPSGKKALVVGVCKGRSKEAMGYTTEAMRVPLDELGYEVLDVIEYYDTKFNPVGHDEDKVNHIKNRINDIKLKL